MKTVSRSAGFVALPVILGCLALTGCPSTQIVDILEKPIRVGVISNNYLDVMLRYRPICDALNRQLKRPVVPLAELNGRSIAIHMKNNPDSYHLLYLDPVSYCQVAKQQKIYPLAIKVNQLDTTAVQGLIVVPVKGPIKQLGDLAGKRFAFGRHGSAYMFYNAIDTLQQGGIGVDDLKELSYSPDCNGVANKLILGWADAGVVTDLWWQGDQTRGLDGKLLKEHLKILASTKPLPEWVWASTEKVSQEDRSKIQLLLLAKLQKDESILKPLSAKKFILPDESIFDPVGEQIERLKKLPDKPLVEL